MKYTIISTVLILKPPLFMSKAKVSGHVFVCGVFRFCDSVFFHIIDTVDIFQN